jgi:hypothetical protein
MASRAIGFSRGSSNEADPFGISWKEKPPTGLVAQAIGGKLNRDTHPGT